jgi:predicted TIM-barrel fold metal-dependent hydrolase
MLIADAQAHIWAASTPERPWPPGRNKPHRPGSFSMHDLLREMNGAGVDRVLIHPPAWEGEYNDLALEAARLNPDRFAVMGRMDMKAPGARGRIRSWCKAQPGMLGLRITFAQGHAEPADDEIWQAAEEGGVPIMMVVSPQQMPDVAKAAERHRSVHMVVDHLGIPMGKKDADAFAHLDELLKLANQPNIAVKASGIPHYTTDSYPYARLHPYLKRVYDAFGPQRIFWGSDFTKLPCTYRQAVTVFTEGIPWLTAEDKTWIMGRGLCEWMGWKLPA